MESKLNPDEVALAARRIAAKMVADQQVPLMMSFVSLSGEPSAEMLADPEGALVVVARGRGKDLLVATLLKGGAASVEIERVPKRDKT